MLERKYTPLSNPLRSRLEAGETILWEGKPDKRTYVFRGSWFMIPFSLLWGGFAIYWEASVIKSKAPLLFWIWGIPFVLVGLYIIFGRFWVAAREVDRTYYAVTNKRIVLQDCVFRSHFVEMSLASLPYLQLSERSSGVGTIYFGSPGPFDSVMVGGWPSFGLFHQTPAFSCVPRAGEIYRLIKNAKEQQRVK